MTELNTWEVRNDYAILVEERTAESFEKAKQDFNEWLAAVEDAAYQQGYEDAIASANSMKSVRDVIAENGGTTPTVQGWA